MSDTDRFERLHLQREHYLDEFERHQALREPETTCNKSLTLGGVVDAYGTECDQDLDHKGKHEGDDPFGSERRVRWNGGGMCAEDPLPATDIEWID